MVPKESAAPGEHGRGTGGDRPHILLIDDDELVLRALRRTMGEAYEITCLGSPVEAAQFLLEGEPVDLVLCDVRMPSLGGPALYDLVRARRPWYEGRFVFLTGAFDHGLEGCSVPVVIKPFARSELIDAVEARLCLAPPRGRHAAHESDD